MQGGRESLSEWVTRVLRDPDPSAELARLGAPARRAVEAELCADEVVRVVLRGTAGRAIVGTDRRVFVLPPFVPGATPAAAASWPYLDVLGVELNERVVGGSVVLHAADGRAAVGMAGDWDVIRARVATLRGLVAGAHSDAVPAELRLIAL
jgi:hypothetical protein